MAQGSAPRELDVAGALQRVASARSRLRGGSAALRAGVRPERVTRHLVAHPLLTIAGATVVGFLAARVAKRAGRPALRALTSAGPVLVAVARKWGPLALETWLARTNRRSGAE